MPSMGEKIRELRKAKGWTLGRLAQESGCTKSYIWEIENRNPPRPSAEKVASIASALGTTIDVLIGMPINTKDDLDPKDKVLFRKYRNLKQEHQEAIRQMVEFWGDK